MDIGHHLCRWIIQQLPALVGGFQKPEIFGRVNGRARTRAIVVRRDDIMPRALCCRQQAKSALGLFVAALQATPHHEELRVMVLMPLAVDYFHQMHSKEVKVKEPRRVF